MNEECSCLTNGSYWQKKKNNGFYVIVDCNNCSFELTVSKVVNKTNSDSESTIKNAIFDMLRGQDVPVDGIEIRHYPEL